MSYSKLKPTYYNSNGLQQQLKNTLFGNHDLCCGCDTPGNHLFYLLKDTIHPSKFSTTEINEIKKCLGIGETTKTTTTEDAEEGFQDGDLEALFAEEDDSAG